MKKRKIVKCELCGKEKEIVLSKYKNNISKKFFCNSSHQSSYFSGENHRMYGKKHKLESKLKVSRANKGRKTTEETKKKISNTLKGKIPKNLNKIAGWNKGLTKESDERVKRYSSKLGEIFKKRKLKKSTKDKISKSVKERIKKGKHKTIFKKGERPWNYIDGRSHYRIPFLYGDDWGKIRQLVYKRDGFTCQQCGITINECVNKYKVALHIHHKIPFLISFDNSLNNLITLCPSCHKKEEYKVMRILNGEIRR